jgi:hypothetical protein
MKAVDGVRNRDMSSSLYFHSVHSCRKCVSPNTRHVDWCIWCKLFVPYCSLEPAVIFTYRNRPHTLPLSIAIILVHTNIQSKHCGLQHMTGMRALSNCDLKILVWVKGKAIPVTGRESPYGWETSRLPDGGKVVSPTRRPPLHPGRFLVLILLEAESTPGP